MPRPMPDTLRDREIVLAGGAGGLGSSAAELLHAEGARLVIGYRRNAGRAERWRDRAAVVQADLASPQDRRRLLDAAPALYGLVVFAGDPARVADPAQMEQALAKSWEVNLAGPILLAREAAERMKSTGTPGAIVLFST